MKIVVYPADVSGCGSHRIIWPAYVAAANGADITIHEPGHRDHIWGESRYSILDDRYHLTEIMNRPEADILVFQRPSTRMLVEAMRQLRGEGYRIVAELDDDLWRIDPRNAAYPLLNPATNADSNWDWLREGLRLADWRVFSTPALRERYGRPGDWVVRNAVPDAYLEIGGAPEHPRIGWAGRVISHPGDLDVVGSGVKKALRVSDGKMWVVGEHQGVAQALQLAGRDVWATGVIDTTHYGASVAAGFNIGIAPLAPTAFNAAKSWLKPLEYLALGVVPVASEIREYHALAARVPFELATTPRSWAECLRHYAMDPTLRVETAAKNREAVRNAGLTVSHVAEQFYEAWSAPRPTS